MKPFIYNLLFLIIQLRFTFTETLKNDNYKSNLIKNNEIELENNTENFLNNNIHNYNNYDLPKPLINNFNNDCEDDYVDVLDNDDESVENAEDYNNKCNETLSTSELNSRKFKISKIFSNQNNNDIDKLNRHRTLRNALQIAAAQGLEAMLDLYDVKEPELFRKGIFLKKNHPGTKLSEFSASKNDGTEQNEKAAYAALITAKKLKSRINFIFTDDASRQVPPKISLRRTPLEALCSKRQNPICPPASKRYRTHDGTCNNARKLRWGSAQLPFHRFIAPAYADGIDSIRRSVTGGLLSSARFISLLVHGSRESNSQITLMLAQWGQLIDHDLTSTAQPRSVNGSVPRCCGVKELHPNCAPIKVPLDDPWLAPLGVRCLEFLRSAPAQRRDCLLSWREQTNQATSYLDASPIYSSNAMTSDASRILRDGLLLYGRGPPREDVCLRGALANQCIRPGDGRSGEQPGLLAMHHVWVGEHNRIALELTELNPHWSDEKVYQESRRIIGAIFQHITYREFLPLVLGKEVCRLFDLELLHDGYYDGYDIRTNPTVSNSFAAAAFRFGHSLIQGSYMRSNRNYQFLDNNVTLHDELANGDMGTSGSLHRLLRGLSVQRAQRRDEFITAELTNHLFQSGSFPFGLDLAAINIQRGRDHGISAYTQWREPCGLSPITDWDDFEKVVGPNSRLRIEKGYRHVDDVDLFVGGLAERPVVGGLVGPTFACIIAQQFSNLRKGDRFWYENDGFESSFTPAQLQSLRQTTLAQVLCRTLGGGTLQPHIFLPHTLPANERQQCGLGNLAKINLMPWLEKDPFPENEQDNSVDRFSHEFQNGKHSKPSSFIIPINDQHTVVDKVDFTPNGDVGIQNPLLLISDHDDLINNNIKNVTAVNNKLDLPPNNVRPNKVHNKLTRPKRKKPSKRRSTTTSTTITSTTPMSQTLNNKLKNTRTRTTTIPKRRRRVTVHSKYIATTTDSTTMKTEQSTKKRRRRRPKRNVDDEKTTGRGSIYVNFNDAEDHQLQKPINNQQVFIETPDQTNYKIEINIKPNAHQMTTSTMETTTKIPLTNSHELVENNDSITVNSPLHLPHLGTVKYSMKRPPYNFFTRRPTQRPYTNNIVVKRPSYGNDKQPNIQLGYDTFNEPTNRPIQYNDFPTLKPDVSNHNYGTNNDVVLQSTSNYGGIDTHRPFLDRYDETIRPQQNYDYNNERPPQFAGQTTVETDNLYDNYDNTLRPQFNPRPTNPYYGNDDDQTIRPIYSTNIKQPQNSFYNRRPTRPVSSDIERPSPQQPTYASYPPLTSSVHKPIHSSGPTYFDDFLIDKQQIQQSTPFSYNTNVKPTLDYVDQSMTSPNYDYNRNTRPQFDNYNKRPTLQYDEYSSQTYNNRNKIKPNVIYLNNEYDNWDRQSTTTYGDLLTFYSVGTTSKTTSIPNYFSKLSASSVTNKIDFPFSKKLPTHRPQKIIHSEFYPHYKTLLLNTDNSQKSNTTKSTPVVTVVNDDYDFTTYAPIYAYDYNEDINSEKLNSFDADGYLRPEHMHYDTIEHKTIDYNINENRQKTDNVQLLGKEIDNYVLPILNMTLDHNFNDKLSLQTKTIQQNFTKEKMLNEIQSRQIDMDIHDKSLDNEIHLNKAFDKQSLTADNIRHIHKTSPIEHNEMRSKKPSLISLVPFEVLTKPERPDNWVLFDVQDIIKPLPKLPELIIDMADGYTDNDNNEEATDELPRPMSLFYNKNRISIKRPF